MLTFVLYFMLCSDWQTDFFPGFQAMPNPAVEEMVIIPIPKITTKDVEDRRKEANAVLTA